MLIGYLVTVILYLAAVVAVIFAVGSPILFLDAPSFVISPLLSFVLCLASFKPAEILGAFRAVFTPMKPEPAVMKKAAVLFETFRNYLIASGVLAAIIGAITMLANMTDRAALGRGMATACLSVFYSLLALMTVVFPMRAILKKRLVQIN